MSFAHVIEFLLLFRREQGPDLRHRFIHHRFCFLHRLLVDGDDLRFGLIENGLGFRLLIRCQFQCFGHMLKRIAVTVPAATATVAVFRLRNGEAAERDYPCGGKCK